MSALTVVVIIESGLVAVLGLFVVALLRSHAEILRRLAGLESPATETQPQATSEPRAPGHRPAPGAPPAGPAKAPADVVGETPDGDAIKLAIGVGSPRTLLAFLSTGCAACAPLWAGLGNGALTPADTRLVVVTKGPERESPGRVVALGPFRYEVLMSTTAWEDFAVPSTPHFVLVDGATGQILGRGGANSWEQILTLVRDADRDSHPARPRSLGSSARAARAEDALARAGVTAGHPSLYPSREPGAGRP